MQREAMKPEATTIASGFTIALAALACALAGCGGQGGADRAAASSSKGVVVAVDAGGAKSTAAAAVESDAVKSAAVKSADAGWGTLRGRFVYDGPAPKRNPLPIDKDQETCGKVNPLDESLVVGQDGGLANVVVYCRTPNVKVSESYAPTAKSTVELDNKDCRFQPHVLPLVLSQTLVVKNSDPVAHNSDGGGFGVSAFNPQIPPGATHEQKFAKATSLPYPVKCGSHKWMMCYVFPRENPYAAVSKPDGTFEIKDLPVGELEFQAWQEKSGYVAKPGWERGRFKMTIKPGDNNDLGTIRVSPSLFEK